MSDQSESKSSPELPIYSVLDSIDFFQHFLILGEVGTGKSTVAPIHEFEKVWKSEREIVIREPSRATCNALYYSLVALYPDLKDDLAVITRDTRINAELGRIKIVTDGVLLRMLAESSVRDASIYFDESHQMTSQLELCMSLARRELEKLGNLIRIMSATIDPTEFLSFMKVSKIYSVSGRRFPVSIEVEPAKDSEEMLDKLYLYLSSQAPNTSESWLVFLPTRRMVEKFAKSFGGTFIHGGLDGSEINKIQQRAELDRTIKIFATNVIASSVNVYVDNVLIFNESIVSKDRFGQKSLEYRALDNNSLLQMIGRVGRFKKGRAIILSDTMIPGKVSPEPVRKALEHETPFDLVLLMSKYGLKFSDLEFISKLNVKEVKFAEDWLFDIGAIDRVSHKATAKGILMSEIPYEPDFAHMISEAILRRDIAVARFLLAAGSYGDSLNHSYRSEMEGVAHDFLHSFDRTSELKIKARLLKHYSEDREGRFLSQLISNGIYTRFVDEAWKNYDAAIDGLNDILAAEKMGKIEEKITLPKEVLADLETQKIEPYLSDCLTFEKYHLNQKRDFDLADFEINGDFYARSVMMNYRKILFDVVALN